VVIPGPSFVVVITPMLLRGHGLIREVIITGPSSAIIFAGPSFGSEQSRGGSLLSSSYLGHFPAFDASEFFLVHAYQNMFRPSVQHER
jgi:hypothetical protein